MQIERHVEPLRRRPERPVLRQVVIDRRVGVADLREAVHQRAAETQLFHAALKLARRDLGILHRQRGKALKAIGPLGDLLGEIIVGPAGHVVSVRRIGNRLYRRRVKRQQHRLDAVLIHQLKPPLMQIEHAAFHFLPDAIGKITSGIGKGFGNSEMFFERDLALHDSPPRPPTIGSGALILTRSFAGFLAGKTTRRVPGMVLATSLPGPSPCPDSGQERRIRALMNTHQNYTLASRPQTNRVLRGWAVLSRGTFSGAIFLTDVALIVAIATLTGIAYHLVAYGE